jgi:hypothetical protein
MHGETVKNVRYLVSTAGRNKIFLFSTAHIMGTGVASRKIQSTALWVSWFFPEGKAAEA